ncbi:carbohydrate ABC transporter permease [Nitrospina sp. 32_T5]|uniref:carbohydrate ABC transporter permease n=1 Tax=unclassified Nitrospina TaxID=2638683 RepID=UPI003F98C786
MRRVNHFLFLFVLFAWSLGPFIWLWITSVKPPGTVAQMPPVWPQTFSLENYRSVLQNEAFLNVVANSLWVSLGATGVSLVVGTMGAFGLSVLMTRNREAVLLALLVVFMLPQVAVVTPLYEVLGVLGGMDTVWGLVLVYSLFTVPLVVWVMTRYFEEIPRTLYHAARVDGCGAWTAFRRVYLPLGVPGMVCAGLLGILFCWNEFLFALTYTTSYASRTIPVGITLFTGQYEFPWGEIAAASSLVTFPILLAVVVAQKYLVRGLVGSGIKG